MLLIENRNYRLFYSGAAASNLADGIAALAFPWLATLITRDPVLIGAVAAANRLPWMLLSIPAGVLTDRADRLKLMRSADAVRCLITLLLVALVLNLPDLPAGGAHPQAAMLIMVLAAAAFALGSAEVLRDNAAQTAMPDVVESKDLERANGQLWSIEQIMGQFVGPPLAGLLIALAVPAPFAVNALAFALSVWCLTAIAVAHKTRAVMTGSFWDQMKEGLHWMRAHPLFLRLGIVLGVINFSFAMLNTILILLAREIYGLSAVGFGILLTVQAMGAVLGGLAGPVIAKRLGGQTTVYLALAVYPIPFLALYFTSDPILAGAALSLGMLTGMVWNVVTVSLRQRLIPTEILGRVNAIYRFLGWGTIPLGALVSGVFVSAGESYGIDRESALRIPYLCGAIIMPLTFLYGLARLRLPQA
jgi:MFS family permease